ncbi:3-phosphoshikimate 1-carboxyvinyltransferase [Lutibacter sp. B2]|nr:3-phosphoshikimate 1-carboxyvinyltransferase [Lutibacter sp. B2]
MKCIKIIPNKLNGQVQIPPSKSMSHRAIICGGLSNGISNIDNIAFSKDIIATLEGMKSFGVKVDERVNKISIKGNESLYLINNKIHCGESGSTLRFLIPMAGIMGRKVTFTGEGKLVERPLTVYYDLFDKQNICYNTNEGKLPLRVDGKLKPGIFEMKGDISSQFITGLMFVLPLLDGDSKIVLTTELESKGYVDLTMDILEKFSVHIENNDYQEFIIKGKQKYVARDYYVEGDFSQAAFFVVAGILGEKISCKGLDIHSLQGDKAIIEIVKNMGANIHVKDDCIEIEKGQTHGIEIDASQCPDIVPILAVLGALSKGVTKIVNAKRLRIKESDRLKSISTELNKLGADIRETEDGLIIYGKDQLVGGTVDSWNDHRIAMALAIASIKCREEVIITNSDSVKKSYPNFWDDFKSLGGKIHEQCMGA